VSAADLRRRLNLPTAAPAPARESAIRKRAGLTVEEPAPAALKPDPPISDPGERAQRRELVQAQRREVEARTAAWLAVTADVKKHGERSRTAERLAARKAREQADQEHALALVKATDAALGLQATEALVDAGYLVSFTGPGYVYLTRYDRQAPPLPEALRKSVLEARGYTVMPESTAAWVYARKTT
jgi:hypothetical protein